MTLKSLEMQLLAAVETELKAVIGDRGIVQRRMVPLLEREDLRELHITPFWDGGSAGVDMRSIDSREITISIAIQQAVPHATSDERGVTVFDGVDNLDFADELFAIAGELSALWGPDGELRNKPLAECVFRELSQDDLFEPRHLIGKGVLSIVLSVTYGHTIYDEED